jgi:glycosyltransferase involved in cell wall biosynthesis
MTCTEFNWRFLRELPGIQPEKIHRVYHGIDLNTFKRSRPLPDGPDFAAGLRRFVSVGRLVEKKGFDVVLNALARLKARGEPFTYDIYGAGELDATLVELTRRLDLTTAVRFHRTATHPQIIERFNDGGIYLGGFKITADGDRDGIPNTVAEAMAMELPVLATNVSGVPELVEHRLSGHLVPPNDVGAFVTAIAQMLANPPYCRALAVRARARVREVFDCECCIESCAGLLRPLLEG